MTRMISACGVICSDCPAFHARTKGRRHQERTAAAWRKIFHLTVQPEKISCGGCGGADDELFQSSRSCSARRCCRMRGYTTCGECPIDVCAFLSKAQAIWDDVPRIGTKLSHSDFVAYAKPYCGHRARIAAARDANNGEARRRSPVKDGNRGDR